jgi:predicted transcriptional regulator
MENIRTNEYIVNEMLDSYDNSQIEEVNKIVSIHRNSIRSSRDFIVRNDNYTADEKITYLNILDILNKVNVGGKIQVTNYDGKVYSMVFINEFLSFLRKPENNFTFSEFKLLLALYEAITKANALSNCLVGIKRRSLAEQAGIDYKNLSKVFKSLQAKEIIKEADDGSIYINYKYFFMGNTLRYDLYKIQYQNVRDQ